MQNPAEQLIEKMEHKFLEGASDSLDVVDIREIMEKIVRYENYIESYVPGIPEETASQDKE